MSCAHFGQGSGAATKLKVDLLDDGVLWAINRIVFHPRGFALGYNPDEKNFTLLGNGQEVWTFAPQDDDDKFVEFEAFLERAKKLDNSV